jgi:hypothetical protein
MSNVLDLKYRRPGEMPEPVAEIVEEPVAQTVSMPAEEASMGVVPGGDDDAVTDADLQEGSSPIAVSWEAHHPLRGHARRRYTLYLGLLVIAGALIGVWQHSIIPFLVMLCAAVTLEVRERWGKPTAVEVNEHGISVNGTRYEHAAFASFHIHQMPDDTLELSLKSDRRMLPHLRLPLGQQDPYELHATLTNYIPEAEHKIPLVAYMLRKPKS